MPLLINHVADLSLTLRKDGITRYDLANLVTYARILDAVRFGQPWQMAATEILELNVLADQPGIYRVWCAHVDRAEWIVGAGLSLIVENRAAADHLVH